MLHRVGWGAPGTFHSAAQPPRQKGGSCFTEVGIQVSLPLSMWNPVLAADSPLQGCSKPGPQTCGHSSSAQKPFTVQILPNQKLWAWGPAVCSTSPLSGLFSNLRTTALHITFLFHVKHKQIFENFHCSMLGRCLPLSAAMGPSLHSNLLKVPTATTETIGVSLSSVASSRFSALLALRFLGEL